MNEIKIYAKSGMWVFDEEKLGLKAEAFVRGCSEILSAAVRQTHPQVRKIFKKEWKVSFGSTPECKNNERLFTVRWMMKEGEGNWYYCPELDKIGWLCGRLYNFFHHAPKQMYFKVALYQGEELHTDVILSVVKNLVAFRNQAVGIQLRSDDHVEDEVDRFINARGFTGAYRPMAKKDQVFHAIQPGTLQAIPKDDDEKEFEIILVKADGREITVQRRKS
jgi:hypothetical protein